jgi:regulator of sigma E protease
MSWLSSLGPIGSALRFIILIIEVLMVFNLMILVHEWGHYLAARWRGLKVEKFYIWFGKPIWKKTINGVEYGLGSIPAGGFVALPQMAPMGGLEGESDEKEPLPPITPLDKIIVAFAGPLFSFLLACLFALLVSWLGKPETQSIVTTTIGYVDSDSTAAKAGLKAGDKILEIDGRQIGRFEGNNVDTVRWAVISSEGSQISFKVERAGQVLPPIAVTPEFTSKAEAKPDSLVKKALSFVFERPPVRQIGIIGNEVPMIGRIQANSPAEEAGLLANDEILRLNGQPVSHRLQIGDLLESYKPEQGPIQLTIQRNQQPMELKVTPRLPDKRPADWKEARVLMGFEWHEQGRRALAHPGVWEQVSGASKALFSMLQKLTSSKSDIKVTHMSGPLGIGRVYYTLLQNPDALLMVLWFSVLLNVNLAIMNMLPFPVLDGGHITMALGEILRRKPLQGIWLERLQIACVMLMMSFFAIVSFKDVGDLIFGPKKGPNPAETIGWLPKDQRK